MDLKEKKLSVLQKIMDLNQDSLLDKINEILDKEMIVAYTVDGKPLTLDLYNERLNVAEQQIAEGKVITQDELEKESENW